MAPENFCKYRVLGADIIKTICATFNEQINNGPFNSFRNGIT